MTYSVLIIENDPEMRKELVSAMSEAGFIIAAVSDYSAELIKLDHFKADLVIVDSVLPSIDGIEACRQMHRTLDIPVVLLGEDYSDEAWNKVLQANVDLYQTKPFSYPVLVARVKSSLRRSKAKRRRPNKLDLSLLEANDEVSIDRENTEH